MTGFLLHCIPAHPSDVCCCFLSLCPDSYKPAVGPTFITGPEVYSAMPFQTTGDQRDSFLFLSAKIEWGSFQESLGLHPNVNSARQLHSPWYWKPADFASTIPRFCLHKVHDNKQSREEIKCNPVCPPPFQCRTIHASPLLYNPSHKNILCKPWWTTNKDGCENKAWHTQAQIKQYCWGKSPLPSSLHARDNAVSCSSCSKKGCELSTADFLIDPHQPCFTANKSFDPYGSCNVWPGCGTQVQLLCYCCSVLTVVCQWFTFFLLCEKVSFHWHSQWWHLWVLVTPAAAQSLIFS